MSVSLRIAIVLSCLASPGAAQVTPACAFTGPTVFPEMEAAKAAFRTGDYPGFFKLVGELMGDTDGTALMADLAASVPDGFESCTTIAQREDVGGLVQEVTLFSLSDGRGYIALHMQSALVDGRRVVLQFGFNSTLTKVLDDLH
jgi:hypothetical protein